MSQTPSDDYRMGWMAKRLPWLIVGGLAAFIVVSVVYWWSFPGPFSDNPRDWGSFGDYMGGVLGPIFGLLTLVVVVAAFLQQHKEMVRSVDQMKETVAASKQQVEAQRKQIFENTFFQMMSLHNEIIGDIETSETAVHAETVFNGPITSIYKGRQALRQLMFRLERWWRESKERANNPDLLDGFNHTYKAFYAENQSQLGHYFRFLYSLIKFVDSTVELDRRFYASLIRAQLSSPELVLLFCHGLSEMGREKFKPLIERYCLLKTLPEKESFANNFRIQYKDSAFFETPDSSVQGA